MSSLNPYLSYSAAFHGAILAALALGARATWREPEAVYRIDFIGPTGAILNRSPDAGGGKAAPAPPAQAQPAKPPPMKDPDAFNPPTPKPLPRPSLLNESPAPRPELKPSLAQAPGPRPAAARPAAEPGPAGPPGPPGPPGASVSADMPDFPYPWYLAGVRSALWDKWSQRMPDLAGECGVAFDILRDGRAVDVTVESSSGEGGFDYAAMTAVQEAAPFPPLPSGMKERFLKVHVRFRSG